MRTATSDSQAEHVIHKCGGVNATARMLGHRNASTVQGWKERGVIPHHRQPELLEAARLASIDLTAEDFIQHLRAVEDGETNEADPPSEAAA